MSQKVVISSYPKGIFEHVTAQFLQVCKLTFFSICKYRTLTKSIDRITVGSLFFTAWTSSSTFDLGPRCRRFFPTRLSRLLLSLIANRNVSIISTRSSLGCRFRFDDSVDLLDGRRRAGVDPSSDSLDVSSNDIFPSSPESSDSEPDNDSI